MSWWQNPLVETFGWTLMHSLWELAAIAMLAGLLLIIMRRASANSRYWICCAAMALMAATPVVTLVWQIDTSDRSAPALRGGVVLMGGDAAAPTMPPMRASYSDSSQPAPLRW